MTQVIDFHTHAFPDKIAERAMAELSSHATWKPALDGTIASLIASMDRAGIQTSVLANIATKPEQFPAILKWSQAIRSERIEPFLSVHPDDPDVTEHIRVTKKEGFKGIKLHPYYQEFQLNDERIFPLYEEIARHGLILLSHTGFDIAYPRDRICDPEKIVSVVEQFPELIFVASHLGSWEDWEEVEKHICGKKIYMEISFAHGWCDEARFRSIVDAHPPEYMLFGTDSPWADQGAAVQFVRSLELSEERERALLCGNAQRLLEDA